MGVYLIFTGSNAALHMCILDQNTAICTQAVVDQIACIHLSCGHVCLSQLEVYSVRQKRVAKFFFANFFKKQLGIFMRV